MSFIKSIVKEINVAKSMFDIPSLKIERDQIKQQIDSCSKQITHYETNLILLDKIYLTASSVNELANICFSDLDDITTAKQLSDKMRKYADSVNSNLLELIDKRNALNINLQLVEEKLKKARQAVK